MSPRKLLMVGPSDDKTMPATYGDEVPPNYYCRGRNVKRQKYCKSRAGHKTDHPRVGRCKFHGGSNQNADRMKSGKYAKIARPELRKLIAAALEEKNPLDMLPTLAKAKGILDHAIKDYEREQSDVALADLTRAADTVSKITFRIEQQRGMIPIDRVRLFMEQVYRHVDDIVKDASQRKRLVEAIGSIRA